MTISSFDVYWIVIEPSKQGQAPVSCCSKKPSGKSPLPVARESTLETFRTARIIKLLVDSMSSAVVMSLRRCR